MLSPEKAEVYELENDISEEKRRYIERGLTPEEADFLLNLSEKEKNQIYHKVDLRLVPMLALLYLIAHLDRANIGNAKIEGMEAELGMSGVDYNVAVGTFFIPYILLEVPSNLLLGKFKRPSRYLGGLVCAWGLVMTASGFIQGFGTLVLARLLIGALEAGFFPGAMWLITQWYEPKKTSFRMSLFYFSAAASGAFSGLLAAAISQMNGLGGQSGWRWIFIIEGIASIAVGVACFFLLPDAPSLSRWLQPGEIRFLNLIHQATRGSSRDHLAEKEEKKSIDWHSIRQVLLDGKIYLQAFAYSSNTVPNYGLKFTMPQIIRNMGFTSTNAQLLTAPPYILGALSAIGVSALSDRAKRRAPYILGPQILLIVAYSVLCAKAPQIANNVATCYTMVIFACVGIYPIIPGVSAWTINNLAGAEKRNVGASYLIILGNCGALVGSFIFLERESPTYPTGFGMSLAWAAGGVVSILLVAWMYHRQNVKNAGMTKENALQKYSEQELEKMGDSSPLFDIPLAVAVKR